MCPRGMLAVCILIIKQINNKRVWSRHVKCHEKTFAFNCWHTNKIWLELAYSAVTWHDVCSIVLISGTEMEDISLEDNILPAFWQKVDRSFWQKFCKAFWQLLQSLVAEGASWQKACIINIVKPAQCSCRTEAEPLRLGLVTHFQLCSHSQQHFIAMVTLIRLTQQKDICLGKQHGFCKKNPQKTALWCFCEKLISYMHDTWDKIFQK